MGRDLVELREPGFPGDRPAVDRLLDLCARADGRPSIGEAKLLALETPDPTAVVAELDEETIGYGQAARHPKTGRWAIEVAVHPLHRHTDLYAALTTHLREEVGEGASVWAFHPAHMTALEDMGLGAVRALLRLRRRLPLQAETETPPDLVVRSFRPGHDEGDWLDANNAALAGHPENSDWDLTMLQKRMDQAWFDPAGFLLGWLGDRLAGFCWTKLHAGGIGEIYVIAVRPDLQRRGYGKALARRGLEHLTERTATVAILFVEADNEPALALYADLGFRTDQVSLCFEL